jgi:NAD(P)-dependent dehydrogenase (short-subunit alcohol dehydrogenase family)
MAGAMAAQRNLTREETFARIASRVPMRRVGTPEEIVQAMLWIVAPENSFMTGQAIAIDGGLTAV